jgi:hypothetical protein
VFLDNFYDSENSRSLEVMESLAALGLASNLIQILDFSSRLISRGYELYKSADGQIAEYVMLEQAATNLEDLYRGFHGTLSSDVRTLSIADRQLADLQAQARTVVDKLRLALKKVQVTEKNRKWQSIYQAVRTVYTDNEISRIAIELNHIRKQVDSAILVSLQ